MEAWTYPCTYMVCQQARRCTTDLFFFSGFVLTAYMFWPDLVSLDVCTAAVRQGQIVTSNVCFYLKKNVPNLLPVGKVGKTDSHVLQCGAEIKRQLVISVAL